MTASPEMLTAEEVADRCRVTARCVTKWAQTGKIPGAMKLNGIWRFNRVSFDNWLNRRATEAAAGDRKWASIGAEKSGGYDLSTLGRKSEDRLAQLLGLPH